MYVAENLRLNKFQKVYLPKNRELFNRFGFRNCGDGYSSSGETTDAVSFNHNKIDMIHEGEINAYAGYAQTLKDNQMPLATDIDKAPDTIDTAPDTIEPASTDDNQ